MHRTLVHQTVQAPEETQCSSTGINPVFKEVIPDDFRMLAGNRGNDNMNTSVNVPRNC